MDVHMIRLLQLYRVLATEMMAVIGDVSHTSVIEGSRRMKQWKDTVRWLSGAGGSSSMFRA